MYMYDHESGNIMGYTVYNVAWSLFKPSPSPKSGYTETSAMLSGAGNLQLNTLWNLVDASNTQANTSSMPRASILGEKSWKISSHTFSGIIRNPMISFDSSSDSWCWFLLIHCRRLNNPTMGPDVDWTPAAGHLLGYQAPEPALLAMDLCMGESWRPKIWRCMDISIIINIYESYMYIYIYM